MRVSQACRMNTPIAIAWPVQAATTGSGPPYRRSTSSAPASSNLYTSEPRLAKAFRSNPPENRPSRPVKTMAFASASAVSSAAFKDANMSKLIAFALPSSMRIKAMSLVISTVADILALPLHNNPIKAGLYVRVNLKMCARRPRPRRNARVALHRTNT